MQQTPIQVGEYSFTIKFQANMIEDFCRMKKREIKIWYGKLEDAERFPDMKFWQAQSDEKKFAAAWEMVLEAHELKGENLRESRLQRTAANFKRRVS